MRFGFKLGFGFKASGAYLSQAVLSMEIGLYSETTIQTTASTVSFIGLPAWLNYDPITKVLSGTPPNTHYGWEKYDVLLNGTITIIKGLTLIIAEDQTIQSAIIEGRDVATTTLNNSLETVSLATSLLLYDGATGWDFLLTYNTKYRENNQLVIIDGVDGLNTIHQNTYPFEDGKALNLMRSIVANSGYSFVSGYEGNLLRYDHVANILTNVKTLSHISGDYYFITLGTNNLMNISKEGADNLVYVIEIDDATYAETLHAFSTTLNLNQYKSATDASHVYCSTVGATSNQGFSKARTGGAEIEMWDCPTLKTVEQCRYGAWTYIAGDVSSNAWTDGYYFVYNGNLIYAGSSFNDLNITTKPWVNQETIESSYYGKYESNRPGGYSNAEPSLTPPVEDADGSGFGIATLDFTVNTVSKSFSTGKIIRIYPSDFRHIASTQYGILAMASLYLGISWRDKTTGIATPIKLGTSLNDFMVDGNIIWMIGYPSCGLFKLDTAQPISATNPIFVTFTRGDGVLGGTGGGQQNATSVLKANDGKIITAGNWVRIGDQMGVTEVDIVNGNIISNLSVAEYDGLRVKDGCITENYIVYLAYDDSLTRMKLAIMNQETKAVSIMLLDTTYNLSGRIIGIEDDEIILATGNAINDLVIARINVATETSIYSKPTDISTTFNADTFKEAQHRFLKGSDGGLYFSIGAEFIFIDVYSGNLIRNIACVSGENFSEEDGIMYSVTGSETFSRSLSSLIPSTLSEVYFAPELIPDGSEWNPEPTNTVVADVLIADGSRTGAWDRLFRHFLLTEFLPDPVRTYTLNVELITYTSGNFGVYAKNSTATYESIENKTVPAIYSIGITGTDFDRVEVKNYASPFIGTMKVSVSLDPL